MRPLKLELTNFGPYPHSVIDFRQFDEAPLFLVTGPTGSGKTTIFDAMVYALFNETTNNQDRNAAALRADFAPADAVTAVQFTFEHADVVYTLTRAPKQKLKNKQGHLVERAAKVSLTYERAGESQTLTRISTVDKFIVDLLHLTKEQFKQLVLLPQGQFRQVLASSSTEKEALLEELFATGLYQQWAQALKEQLAHQEAALKTQNQKLALLKQAVPQIDATLPTPTWQAQAQHQVTAQTTALADISREIAAAQTAVQTANAQLQQAQSVQADQATLAKLTAAATQLTAQAPHIQHRQRQLHALQWYQRQQTTYLKWQTAQQDLAAARAARQTAQTARAEAVRAQQTAEQAGQTLAAQAPTIEQQQAQRLTLISQLPEFEARARLQAQVATQQRQVEQLTAQVAELTTQRDQQQAQQAQLTAAVARADAINAQAVAVERQTNELQQTTAALTRVQEQQTTLTAAEAKLQTARQTAQQTAAALATAQATLKTQKDAYARAAIRRLAADLQPGTPCPVCGSRDHPHPAPAVAGGEEVTAEMVEAAETAVTAAIQAASRAASQVSQQEQQVEADRDQLNQQLTALAQQLGVAAELPTVAAAVAKAQATLTQTRATLEQEQVAVTQAKQDLQALSAPLEQTTTNLATQTDHLRAARETLAAQQAQLQAQTARLGERTLAEVQAEIEQLTTRLQTYHQAVTQNQAALTQAKQDQAVAQTQLAAADKQVTAAQAVSEQTQAALQTALAAFDPQLTWDFWAQAQADLSQQATWQAEVDAYRQQQAANAAQQKQLQARLAQAKDTVAVATAKAALKAAEATLADRQAAKGQQTEQLAQLQATLKKVATVVKAQAAHLEEQTELNTLVQVVTGNSTTKLSLPRYILQTYFSQVLTVANQYLLKLSEQRYSFKLDEQVGKGRGQKWSGLEINVHDNQVGQDRSARTLSGGESFLASLSLALGLCEEIQRQAGGVQIDALFIDEGFGSLDQNALQTALNALLEIQGHRMIGVISHVTEMKEQIPDQLVVHSHDGRSTVSYRHAD